MRFEPRERRECDDEVRWIQIRVFETGEVRVGPGAEGRGAFLEGLKIDAAKTGPRTAERGGHPRDRDAGGNDQR
jgi:hypothetical protein